MDTVILQSDPGWLAARRGMLTASRMNDACAYLKSGKEAEARRKYKVELVGERMADYAVNHFVTAAMQRGLDCEPDARRCYETRTGAMVKAAALVNHPTIEFFGATPDGFIDADGLLEIKVPLVPTYIGWLEAGIVPEDHVMQMTAQLACTGRQWVDFVAFCPEMRESRNLFVRRFTADEEAIANCEAAAKQFLAEVDELFERVTSVPA